LVRAASRPLLSEAQPCEIDFIISARDLARLHVSPPARLHVTGVWRGRTVSSWFGGIRCGSPPRTGHSQSIISGQPIIEVRVTTGGLLIR
jgi:hypothetical protein